ncbi:MAG: hypothetical protein ACM3UL_05255 [Ignavibacteria bacterium]
MKLEESTQSLRCFAAIETESFNLYEKLSKKINHPESSLILGIAYDSLKSSKILQAILECFDQNNPENVKTKKDLTDLALQLSTFSKEIQRINCLNYQSSCEVLKELTKLEKLLTDTYSSYAHSSAINVIAQEVTKYANVNIDNFAKVFEKIADEKERHREELVEIIYALEQTEANRLRQITPVVKYQNPDAWIRGSTIQTFSANPTVSNAAE